MNPTSAYEFTIIVPVFDEEDNIYPLESRLTAYVSKCEKKACVLFVNDGSRDLSGARIKEVCTRNEDFHFLQFESNCGLSAALRAGIDYAESPYIGYMDADLQTAPEDFSLLLPYLADFPLVTGVRTDRQDSAFKRIQSAVANAWRRMMTGDGALDTGCPLKVMRTDVARKMPYFDGMHRFIPALVLLQEGCSFRQVPVRHFRRAAGRSKFNLANRLIRPFVDCLAYRWMRSRLAYYKVSDTDLKPLG